MDNLEFVEGNLVRHIDHDEWGIGSVEEIVRDRALVRFYAPEETVRQCPLAALRRHRYTRGDQIFAITENTYGIVQSAREFAGMVIYQVLFGGRRKGIPETNIRPTTLEPELFDLLRDSDGSESRAFLLALQARRLQYAYRYDELVCLSNARIELLPHQVFVADRVLRDEPHRFLLSDEVGLGKTIEAGLILKELRARGSARQEPGRQPADEPRRPRLSAASLIPDDADYEASWNRTAPRRKRGAARPPGKGRHLGCRRSSRSLAKYLGGPL